MDYELAKELQKAKFPKSKDWVEHSTLMKGNYFMVDGYGVANLSELIDACGKGFCCLLRCSKEGYPESYEKYFGADDGMYGDKFGLSTMEYVGSTPEEAVARLWLALNKK